MVKYCRDHLSIMLSAKLQKHRTGEIREKLCFFHLHLPIFTNTKDFWCFVSLSFHISNQWSMPPFPSFLAVVITKKCICFLSLFWCNMSSDKPYVVTWIIHTEMYLLSWVASTKLHSFYLVFTHFLIFSEHSPFEHLIIFTSLLWAYSQLFFLCIPDKKDTLWHLCCLAPFTC